MLTCISLRAALLLSGARGSFNSVSIALLLGLFLECSRLALSISSGVRVPQHCEDLGYFVGTLPCLLACNVISAPRVEVARGAIPLALGLGQNSFQG